MSGWVDVLMRVGKDEVLLVNYINDIYKCERR